jgi:hypothetical protein
MNYITIILGVLVILLLYYLYRIYYVTNTTLASQVNLNLGSKTIDTSSLVNNGSTNYSYALWVYVNSWSNNTPKTLFYRGSDNPVYGIQNGILTPTSNPDVAVYLDQTSPTLYLYIAPSNPAIDSKPIIITNNFPIQTWAYVVVSVNGDLVDIYLNGKLIASHQLSGIPVVSKNGITMGDGTNPDIYLAMFKRSPNVMDPQTAWNNYLKANGMYNMIPTYNVVLSILENNKQTTSYQIF